VKVFFFFFLKKKIKLLVCSVWFMRKCISEKENLVTGVLSSSFLFLLYFFNLFFDNQTDY